MSRLNPRKAMAALLPLPIRIEGKGKREKGKTLPSSPFPLPYSLVVRPMTLGMWAALERIGSPLVTCEEPKDALELIPSLYLLTHDPREVFRGNIIDLAMQWADTVPPTALAEIQNACYRQMNAAFDVMPELDPKKTKSAGATAGSLRSSTSRPKPTTGDSGKSCGKCRSRRSASSGGSSSSSRTAR